jgi:hypothetical protein
MSGARVLSHHWSFPLCSWGACVVSVVVVVVVVVV